VELSGCLTVIIVIFLGKVQKKGNGTREAVAVGNGVYDSEMMLKSIFFYCLIMLWIFACTPNSRLPENLIRLDWREVGTNVWVDKT
jgi:hypothetical protein